MQVNASQCKLKLSIDSPEAGLRLGPQSNDHGTYVEGTLAVFVCFVILSSIP